MKAQYIFVLFVALLTAASGYANADEKSRKTTKAAEAVQSSVDKPDSTHKGSVTGTVIDDKGKAVENAKVELTDTVTKEQPLSVVTDKKGQYIFSGLLPGAYMIQAKTDGMQSDSVGIKVTNAQTAGPKLILSPRKM